MSHFEDEIMRMVDELKQHDREEAQNPQADEQALHHERSIRMGVQVVELLQRHEVPSRPIYAKTVVGQELYTPFRRTDARPYMRDIQAFRPSGLESWHVYHTEAYDTGEKYSFNQDMAISSEGKLFNRIYTDRTTPDKWLRPLPRHLSGRVVLDPDYIESPKGALHVMQSDLFKEGVAHLILTGEPLTRRTES